MLKGTDTLTEGHSQDHGITPFSCKCLCCCSSHKAGFLSVEGEERKGGLGGRAETPRRPAVEDVFRLLPLSGVRAVYFLRTDGAWRP